jgi:hypothetical protein
MTELLELLLELVCSLLDCWWAWRFSLCILGSLLLVGGICALVTSDTVQTILAVPVVAAWGIGGLMWEGSAKRFW